MECTSAAIQALTSFKKLYPGHRREEIQCSIEKAASFIEKTQASDGSWFAPPLRETTFLISFSIDTNVHDFFLFFIYSCISSLFYSFFCQFLFLIGIEPSLVDH